MDHTLTRPLLFSVFTLNTYSAPGSSSGMRSSSNPWECDGRSVPSPGMSFA